MLVPVKGEPIIKLRNGRWEYCRDTETGWRGYLHLNCDAVEHNGYCVMCGATVPGMLAVEGDRPVAGEITT